jgi:hypothetical protein
MTCRNRRREGKRSSFTVVRGYTVRILACCAYLPGRGSTRRRVSEVRVDLLSKGRYVLVDGVVIIADEILYIHGYRDTQNSLKLLSFYLSVKIMRCEKTFRKMERQMSHSGGTVL